MAIIKLGGTTALNDIFIAALQWKPIDYRSPENSQRMTEVMKIVSALSQEQKDDFLILNQQWYCFIPEEFSRAWYKDVWSFIAAKTPAEFKGFYVICSKRRESSKWIQAIFENTN